MDGGRDCATPPPPPIAGEMLSDRELWACAATILEQHGAQAPLHVAERLGALALAGDTEGIAAWQQIAARIEALQRKAGRA